MSSQHDIYDLIIIGAGPAGLTASIYASRYRIHHLVLATSLGGAMATASSVENYPGFKAISGLELTNKMVEQTKNLGGEIKLEEAVEIKKTAEGFLLTVTGGKTYTAKALILATGTSRQKLGIPGEKEYLGKGVSYCSTCDAAFFRNKTVAVVGGANAAVMSAVHTAEFCHKVYLVYRRKPLRAEPIWVERVEKNPKITVLYETQIIEILGNNQFVTEAKLNHPVEGSDKLKVDGVFIEIGGVPLTDLVKPLGVEIDERSLVHVKPNMATNVQGLYAAGDIANVSGELQQIIVACGEGALAALSAFKYLKGGQ